MAGETMLATVKVIGSHCSRIIGKIIQNPGDTEMCITFAAKLRFDITYNTNKIKDGTEQMNAYQ